MPFTALSQFLVTHKNILKNTQKISIKYFIYFPLRYANLCELEAILNPFSNQEIFQ